jgi:hypothetical protein
LQKEKEKVCAEDTSVKTFNNTTDSESNVAQLLFPTHPVTAANSLSKDITSLDESGEAPKDIVRLLFKHTQKLGRDVCHSYV